MTEAQAVKMQQDYALAAQGLSMTDFISPRQAMSVEGETAIIHISGALVKSAPPIHEKLGNSTYDTISDEIDAAEAAGVANVVFQIDSGGGGVTGLAELSEKISEMNAKTVGFSDGSACSAAYYLMAACDHIHATHSANVGNIGVVMRFTSDSENNIKVIANDGADLKGAGMSGLSESQENFLKSRVDKLGEEFRIHVEKHRLVNSEVFRAGWYYGQEAIELGLVDSDGTRKQLLKNL